MEHAAPEPVILASTSRYRAELLSRLGVQFEQVAPDCDETPKPGESPSQLVERLAADKAASIASNRSSGLIIGSDQVADHNGTILGKPGTPENATRQLSDMSGDLVVFRTGYCVIQASTGQKISGRSDVEAKFRILSSEEVARYLQQDKPFDCAGSFRSESLGISLLESMLSDDPSTIIGLPLIKIAQALRDFGTELP